jgi:quercetin dioxygenase-like cupin family protein
VKTVTAEQIAVADNPHGVDVRHLYSTPDVVVSQITLEPGEVVKPHKAPVDAFFYVLEGAPLVEIEGEAALGEPGMLVPSAKGRVHAIRNESAARARFLVVKTPNPKA